MFAGKRKIWVAAGALLVIVAGAGGAGAVVAMGGDDDAPLTGAARDKAIEAALDYTGGGTVTETETGDDGAAYSVEVRLDDGRHVEVNLDNGFRVINGEPDDDGAGGEEDRADDN